MNDFDQLLATYQQTMDTWVAAIREEEGLATPDHSMIEMEKWDTAALKIHAAEAAAKQARDAYQDALRQKNYGF